MGWGPVILVDPSGSKPRFPFRNTVPFTFTHPLYLYSLLIHRGLNELALPDQELMVQLYNGQVSANALAISHIPNSNFETIKKTGDRPDQPVPPRRRPAGGGEGPLPPLLRPPGQGREVLLLVEEAEAQVRKYILFRGEKKTRQRMGKSCRRPPLEKRPFHYFIIFAFPPQMAQEEGYARYMGVGVTESIIQGRVSSYSHHRLGRFTARRLIERSN